MTATIVADKQKTENKEKPKNDNAVFRKGTKEDWDQIHRLTGTLFISNFNYIF